MQRRLRLVRHVQRVRIITAPVKALVRLVQRVRITIARVIPDVRPVVPVITTIVPVRRVVLTAVRAITAQADLTERLVAQVHILQPPMQRHQRLVRLAQRVHIITAPVKVHVRLVAVIHILQRKPAVVRIVRADNMSIRLIPVAILIH